MQDIGSGLQRVVGILLILMGMTLPLIVHFARRLYPDGTALGSMYAANIAGAAIGTCAEK